jgi:hypothetical protein
MRFFADGPNILDELLEAQDNGNVVFFCGAGISRPAGLPGFLGLAKEVVDSLGAPTNAKSRLLLNRTDQEPDFAPPLDQVFYLLQQEYGAATIDQVVSELLETPPEADVANHKIILKLSRSASGRLQLVTTNFDHLFERADSQLTVHIPPALPDLAMGQPLEGLVYLHGRRVGAAFTGGMRQGLVLSSADFGRAYLADGWATKFVRDLLRNYVIVLVGYSASDPPVRYLLEGLHSLGDRRAAKIYAFDQGEEHDVHDRWRDRGVRPLAYAKSGLSHSALWKTLTAWADRAEDPERWRRSIIDLARHGPTELQPYQRGQVCSLVRSLPGAKLLADADPPPPAKWLCVFDRYVRYAEPRKSIGEAESYDPLTEYGLDDDPPRPPTSEGKIESVGDDLISSLSNDEQPDGHKRLAGIGGQWADLLPPRLFHLARWIVRLLDDPITIWWAAGYHTLHSRLLDQIDFESERSGDQRHELANRAWALLLEKFRYSRDDHDHQWYRFLSKIKKHGWTEGILREFELAVRPYLKSSRPWGRKPSPPTEPWSELRLHDVVEFEVHFPARDTGNLTIPTERLREVFRIARRALERGSVLLGEIETRYWRTASFHPEHKAGERHLDEPSVYLHWIRNLFDRLTTEYPDFARAEVQRWPAIDEFFFDKLKIYAWMKAELFSGEQAARRASLEG